MWVFGYGSLMWDDWHSKFGCTYQTIATLRGHRRTFNKASTERWGTKKHPCPTLNLEPKANGTCKGIAFEFPDNRAAGVLDYLKGREGPNFALDPYAVTLEDGREIQAHVPIYRGKVLALTRGRSLLAKQATGEAGRCTAYIEGIATKLADLGIEDPVVTQLYQAVRDC